MNQQNKPKVELRHRLSGDWWEGCDGGAGYYTPNNQSPAVQPLLGVAIFQEDEMRDGIAIGAQGSHPGLSCEASEREHD